MKLKLLLPFISILQENHKKAEGRTSAFTVFKARAFRRLNPLLSDVSLHIHIRS